ncbi:hypothetical protein HN51_023062 [Arachis hypogaea]
MSFGILLKITVESLSYNSLPHRLKTCFLYFGMFPEDYAIPVKRLILLWTAEGLIEPPKTGILDALEVEDIAEEYLNELVDCSLVMVAKRSDGGVKSCRIHDLLLDLCISESRAEKGIERSLENCIRRRQNLDRMGFDSARILDFGCNDYVISSMAQDLTRSFPNLEVIHLTEVKMKEWILEKGAMPSLQHLIIKYCRLGELPTRLWSLPNLQDVLVVDPKPSYRARLGCVNPKDGCKLG